MDEEKGKSELVACCCVKRKNGHKLIHPAAKARLNRLDYEPSRASEHQSERDFYSSDE